jgi:hypothetical protein
VIAAALLLQAADPVTVAQVGPFVVETHVRRLEGPMYPLPQGYELKSTVLRWKSPSALSEYELVDDGQAINASFTVGRPEWKCLVASNRLPLTDKPNMKFDVRCEALTITQARQLKSEIRAAQPYFAAAYAQFRTATLKHHGPRLTRCRDDEFGNHGPICVAFWDEGRAVNDQQKNKRTN